MDVSIQSDRSSFEPTLSCGPIHLANSGVAIVSVVESSALSKLGM